MLKLSEIVVLTKSLLDSLVRVLLRWVGHEVQDSLQALLGQGVDDQVKLHLLVFDVTQAKPRLAMPNHASEFSAQKRGRRREPPWLL
jgi:hypothetical protein